MVNRLWLFGLILAIPIIGFAVSEGIQYHLDLKLRAAAQREFAYADSEAISRLSYDLLCKDIAFSSESICSTTKNLNLMSLGAFWAAAVGLGLVLLIKFAGSISRTNRLLLLYFFKPGLYLTTVALIGLVLVHAAIATAAIYYGESVLVGRVHVYIIGAIGLGALAGIGAMIPKVFSIVRKAETYIIGITVSHERAPALWQHIEKLAEQIGALPPENIVVGLEPNFFVTEADVISLNEKSLGRTLYCSLPLSRILNRDEFSSVICHELSHYKGLDTEFSHKFYPIYRGTVDSIESLEETGEEGFKVIALFPAIAIYSYFLESFAVAENRISRERELAADKEAAAITNPVTVASALIKVHAFSSIWQRLQQAMPEVLEKGKIFVNASKTYAELASEYATREILHGIDNTHLSHPTDSHPALALRLGALDTSVEGISEAALKIPPAEAILELLPEAELLEEEISAAYQGILARQLHMDLESQEESQEEPK